MFHLVLVGSATDISNWRSPFKKKILFLRQNFFVMFFFNLNYLVLVGFVVAVADFLFVGLVI